MSMNVDLGIWEKLRKVVLFLLFIAALLGIAFWYLPLFQQNERMRKQILSLENQIRKEEETARQLDLSVKTLLNDPKTLERLARERLGYARTGETVIYFETGAATNAPQPRPVTPP